MPAPDAISVFYDDDCDALWVSTRPDPFMPGTLVAEQSGDTLIIRRCVGPNIVAGVTFDRIMREDGTGFPDAASALAYLRGEFAKRRTAGETFGVPVVAGADLTQGQPVTVSRASGQLLPARADTYALAFVAGLASADTAQGFPNQPAHGAVTFPDWTGLTGTAVLAVGQPYFLDVAGGLTLSPDRSACAGITRVGCAIAPNTLVVQPLDPIRL